MSDKFDKLLHIMKALRAPNGCPWDRQQTHASIKSQLIEEAYELLEAIDENDPTAIAEELGDLLLHIAFHIQIAEENNEFTADTVIDGINTKLIRRHPHVFSDAHAATPHDVLKQWEEIKKKEKKRKSILDGIPRHLPAVLRACKLQQRAAHVGFDWDNFKDVIAKLHEELDEFEEARKAQDAKHMEEELGDALFSLINVARYVGSNPEDALQGTMQKFIDRFQYIEKTLLQQGSSIEQADLKTMDALWNEAKRRGPSNT